MADYSQIRNDEMYSKLIRIFWRERAGEKFRTAVDIALDRDYPIDYIPTSRRVSLFYYVLDLNPTCPTCDSLSKDEYYKTISFLLDKGVNVNLLNQDNWNALMYACNTGLPSDLLSRIIEVTDDVNHVGERFPYSWNGSALHDTNALQLAAGIFIWEDDFSTPEDKAAWSNRCWNNIKVLIEAGADLSTLDIIKEDVFLGDNEPENKRAYKKLMALIETYKQQKIQLDAPYPYPQWDYEL